MIKKFSALTIALIIAVTAFSGCSKSDDKSSSAAASSSSAASSETDSAATESTAESTVPDAKLVIDGEEVDTSDLIICTIDGHDVDFDTFRYYYYYTQNQYLNNYGATLDTIRETEGGFENLLESTISNIKQEYVVYRLCEENGITLTDEDKQTNEDTYNSNLEASASEEEFNQILHDSYLTPELYKTMLDLAALYTHCQNELFTNEGVYATTKDEFREIVQDPEKYACVRSILIPYECKADITDSSDAEEYDGYSLSEKYSAKKYAYSALDDDAKEAAKADAKKVAETAAQKAADGEDFESLISEYNWDSGQESYPDGYYITPDTSYVQEYLDAVFSLSEGEVSGLVESEDYGWFIIKRMPIDMDYVEENIESMIQDYDLPARQELYRSTMEDMDVTYSDIYKKLDIDSIT